MLSKKDLMILTQLRKNARINLKDISKKTCIPISTIFDKMRGYENEVIERHTTLLNFAKLGFNARANILVSFEKEEREKAREYLLKNPNVNSVYRINNGFDFMLEGLFRTIKEMEDFLSAIESHFKVKELKFYYIIEDVKKEGFLSDPMLADLVIRESDLR